MAGKIIINADLYDNVLTRNYGNFVVKPLITVTFLNADVAAIPMIRRS